MSTWTMDHHFAATIAYNNDIDHGEVTHTSTTDIPTAFVFYAIIAILVMIIVLIVKLMWDINGEEAESATENSGLLSPKEGVLFSYSSYGATSFEEDLESGKGSCSSSSLSDDLYDEKICVICYDHQRNCFFVPCGHCVACHSCAKRILNEEMKTCPICRTFIDKVRELHIL